MFISYNISGLLAVSGLTDIPIDVYAWTAVFILPINSALNPFLYTLTAMIRDRVTLTCF